MRLACSFVLFSKLLWAQSFEGSLRGRVTDPHDAVVPVARVVLIEEATCITATDPGYRSPGYVEQMSFDLQRQLDKNTLVQVGYIGSHTLDQLLTISLDQLYPGYFSLGSAGLNKVVANPFYGFAPTTVSLGTSTTLAQANLLTQYPQYTSVGLSTPMGRSTYYAFYAKGQWRNRYGLTLNATYTWSRNMSLSAPQNYDASSSHRDGPGPASINPIAFRCRLLTSFLSGKVRC